MEQLIFVAIFLLAGLGDLLIRWLRKKGERRDPESRDELVILEDAGPVSEEEEEAWFEPRPIERPIERPPERPPKPVKAEPPPIRALSIEEIAARPIAEPPSPATSRAVRPAPLPPRRARPRRWIAGPVSARQGIVAMTILGRCRGLE